MHHMVYNFLYFQCKIVFFMVLLLIAPPEKSLWSATVHYHRIGFDHNWLLRTSVETHVMDYGRCN